MRMHSAPCRASCLNMHKHKHTHKQLNALLWYLQRSIHFVRCLLRDSDAKVLLNLCILHAIPKEVLCMRADLGSRAMLHVSIACAHLTVLPLDCLAVKISTVEAVILPVVLLATKATLGSRCWGSKTLTGRARFPQFCTGCLDTLEEVMELWQHLLVVLLLVGSLESLGEGLGKPRSLDRSEHVLL